MYSFLNWPNKWINFVNEIIHNKGNAWPLQNLKEKYGLYIIFAVLYCADFSLKNHCYNNKGDIFGKITPYIPFYLETVTKLKQKIQHISHCVNLMISHHEMI